MEQPLDVAALFPLPGGDDGGPSAVAADEARVYLGWSGVREGHPLVAVSPDGEALWKHREEGACGVRGVAAEQGTVYVLGHGGEATMPGSVVYRLEAATGAPQLWEGRAERQLRITSLWPASAETQSTAADAIAIGNGRLYLSFTTAGFIAVLDARSGTYVTTLSGPSPGPMALSTTPMSAVDGSGKMEVADFGVAILMGRAASYFVMPHDPPWVAMNTTRWLAEEERITAFTMRAQTMTTGDVQLYFGLDAPQSQVQVRPASDPTGFTFSVGAPGGREARGPWRADALRGICSIAIDAKQQLWIAESGRRPARFSVWTTTGREATLLREHFGPPGAGEAAPIVSPDDPEIIIAQGCEWRRESPGGRAICVGVIAEEAVAKAEWVRDGARTLLVLDGVRFERRGPGEWARVEP